MLERELAQATKIAAEANKKVEQLRRRLVSESEKASARAKRELVSARRQRTAANTRLKKARTNLRKKATPDNQQKVDALLKQVQELADAVTKITVTAYEAAEKLVAVKADAILAERKAKAADRAASFRVSSGLPWPSMDPMHPLRFPCK